jgi:hypothetical protein
VYSEKSNNQIKALLQPDSSIKIPLMMGINVSSPKPQLAPDKIPKFNFVDAMKMDVNVEGRHPRFPNYLDRIGEDFVPAPSTHGPDQWTKVKKAWEASDSVKNSQVVLTAWCDAYKWEKDIKIVALPPKRTLKKFSTVYMAAPLMCVSK